MRKAAISTLSVTSVLILFKKYFDSKKCRINKNFYALENLEVTHGWGDLVLKNMSIMWEQLLSRIQHLDVDLNKKKKAI